MQFSGQTNDFNNSIDLQRLLEVRSDRGPIFSLYLDIRAKKEATEDPLHRFMNMLEETERKIKLDHESPEYQEQWYRETAQIRGWLEMEELPKGQGLVVISSQAAGLWQAAVLPFPMLDQLVVKDQPYVRPLEILAAEQKSALVVLIDAVTARLVEVVIGQAREADRIEAVPVTGAIVEDGLRQHARSVAERVEAVWQDHSYDHLVIGGDDEALSLLRDELPALLLDRLVGEITLSPRDNGKDFLVQVQEIESEYEEDLEAERVHELITSAEDGKGAVLGLDQTLLAVRDKKVRLLVVEEGFHMAGGECPNCGFLGEGQEGICLLCGMALRPEPDVIEAALKRVIDNGGEIEILRSREMRRALAPYDRIGALVYDRESTPLVRETANQLPIEESGRINRETHRDETVEESFPASDPPSAW